MTSQRAIPLSSGIQPDSYSGTRSALSPRPATLAVLLRLRRPAGFGFQKIRCATNAQRIFRTFRKCTPSVLGAGRLRSLGDPNTLRANPIPEDIPMNQISLIGIIESVPVSHNEDGVAYTSFRLRVHGSYLDSNSDPYNYTETYTVICIGKPQEFIRIVPRDQEIEVTGELRTRTHVIRVGGPITIEVGYPLPEVVVDSIKWHDFIVTRTGGNDTLIALYKPDPA
jgi:hypothetical protein